MSHNNRFLMALLGVVLVLLVFPLPAHASKEGLLSLYSVILDSPGTTESGPVHVEMKRSDSGIGKLMVSAFGRNETAPPQLLQSIKRKAWINGVQLSWGGSGIKGGRYLNVVLTEGGSWGAIVVAVVAFSEDGKFAIVTNLGQDQVEEAERR
jgi:hypothetical protein